MNPLVHKTCREASGAAYDVSVLSLPTSSTYTATPAECLDTLLAPTAAEMRQIKNNSPSSVRRQIPASPLTKATLRPPRHTQRPSLTLETWSFNGPLSPQQKEPLPLPYGIYKAAFLCESVEPLFDAVMGFLRPADWLESGLHAHRVGVFLFFVTLTGLCCNSHQKHLTLKLCGHGYFSQFY